MKVFVREPNLRSETKSSPVTESLFAPLLKRRSVIRSFTAFIASLTRSSGMASCRQEARQAEGDWDWHRYGYSAGEMFALEAHGT